jgi:hypothetical protein
MQLDFSDAVLEPSFQETFQIIQREEVVNQFGESGWNATILSAIGVIVPASEDDLERLPEADYGKKAIAIVTRAPLRLATQGYKPDLIWYHGDLFVVAAVEDYTTIGTGFFSAVASSIDFLDVPEIAGLFGTFDFSKPIFSGLVTAL